MVLQLHVWLLCPSCPVVKAGLLCFFVHPACCSCAGRGLPDAVMARLFIARQDMESSMGPGAPEAELQVLDYTDEVRPPQYTPPAFAPCSAIGRLLALVNMQPTQL